MKKYSKKLGVAALMLSGFMASNSAQAISTLSGTFTVDDEYTFYLSTNNVDNGELLGSNNVWNEASTFSKDLVAGQDYFLHVFGGNVENNHPSINPSGFLGDFSLSDDSTHVFLASGGIDGSTGTGNWTYGLSAWDEDIAVENATAPNGSNRDFGKQNAFGVVQSGLNSIAANQWIWSNDHSATPNSAFFTLAIKATGDGDVNPVPVPGAVWLFGSGLLGFIGMRKKA